MAQIRFDMRLMMAGACANFLSLCVCALPRRAVDLMHENKARQQEKGLSEAYPKRANQARYDISLSDALLLPLNMLAVIKFCLQILKTQFERMLVLRRHGFDIILRLYWSHRPRTWAGMVLR